MRKSRQVMIVKTLFLTAMWAVCIYFVVKLSSEYDEKGKKGKTKTEFKSINSLVAPWLAMETTFSNTCKYSIRTCTYLADLLVDTPQAASCGAAVQIKPDGTVLLNRSTLQKLGHTFTSSYDMVVLSFFLVSINDSREMATSDCIGDSADAYDLTVIPVGDHNVVNSVERGDDVNLKKLGVPTYIGPGQKSQLTFTQQQEVFLSGAVANTTLFSLTQFPKFSKERIDLHIQASSFTVTRVVHNEGQSFIDLMGGIFGWIGVLTGACIHSLFASCLDFLDTRRRPQEEHPYLIPLADVAPSPDAKVEIKPLKVEMVDPYSV